MTSRSLRADIALQNHIVDSWIGQQRSPNTRAAYHAEIAAFGRWCDQHGTIALRADTDLVVAYATARRAAGDRPSTLRRRWSALSSFYDFAIRHEATTTNPLVGMPRPRTATGNPSMTAQLSPHAVARYRAVAATLDPRLELLVALLVADGLKLGEALALDISDIRGRPPKVSLAVRRRNTLTLVGLDSASGRALYRCIGNRRDGPLFLSSASRQGEARRLTRFGADHLIRQLGGDDHTRVTSNELRRYHITNSQRADGDLFNARDRAGLAHVRSVRRYLLHAELDTQD